MFAWYKIYFHVTEAEVLSFLTAQEIGSGDYSNLAIISRNNVFAEAKLMR